MRTQEELEERALNSAMDFVAEAQKGQREIRAISAFLQTWHVHGIHGGAPMLPAFAYQKSQLSYPQADLLGDWWAQVTKQAFKSRYFIDTPIKLTVGSRSYVATKVTRSNFTHVHLPMPSDLLQALRGMHFEYMLSPSGSNVLENFTYSGIAPW